MGNRKTGILFVPQEAFFFKVEDMPPGLSEGDLRSYAQTLVESNSPLPIDLLRWGFCASEGKILIFASAADVLLRNKKLLQPMVIAPRVIPFAALLWGMKFKDGWNLAARRIDSEIVEYAAIKVSNGKWIDVFALTKKADSSEKAALDKLCKLAGIDSFDYRYDFSIDKRGLLNFEIILLSDSGEKLCITHGGFKFFARADVRDPVSLRAAYKNVFKNRLALASFVCALVFLVALVFWNLSFLYRKSEISSLSSTFEKLRPESELVQQMGGEVLFLRDISSKQLNNMLLLAKVNRSRPEGINFSKSAVSGPRNIEVKGRSSSVALIKDFEKALKNRADVKEVNMQTSGATAGGTSWTLNVEFKE